MTHKLFKLSATLALAAGFCAGCAGPEQKLGRGVRNATEFGRLGELQRSVEQTALWDGNQRAYTTGAIRGFNRSLARTAYGAWEIVTFPFPPYAAQFTPKGYIAPDYAVGTTRYPYGGMKLTEDPAYPSNNKPGLPSDPTFDAGGDLGFDGGVIGRSIPGSRFRIFENGQ